jgi:hypothetical protein
MKLLKILLKILVVLAATGVMGSAQAQGISLGTLSPTVQTNSFFSASGGSFADIYNFTIQAGYQTLSTSAVSYSPTGTGLVSNLTLTVYGGSNGTGSALGTVSSSNGSLINYSNLLGTGLFSVKVSGLADTKVGGGYNFRISATPEPAEWMMLLAGLVAVTFMARRKTIPVTG